MNFEQIFESEERKHVKAHFENMIDLAKADGSISEQEMKHLQEMATRFNITQEEFNKMLTRENDYPFNPPISKDERYLRFVNLIKLVIADDVVDPFEVKCLHRFAAGLSLPDQHIDSLIEHSVEELKKGTDTDDIIEMFPKWMK